MSLFKGLVLSLFAYFALTAAALADHMTGQYSGTGNAAGTFMTIQQTGWTITGQLTGATKGTLNGQSDGGENVTGTITIEGVGQLQFQATHSQSGMTIKLTGNGGTEEYVFSRGTASTPEPQPQPVPQPQPQPNPPPNPPQQGSGEYYVGISGQQVGPVTAQQILAALASGEVKPTDLVWKQGMPNWVAISTLPEFAQTTNGPPPLPPASDDPPPVPTGDNNTGPGQVPYNSEQAKVSAIMLGSTLGIFAHELGHAMIGELGLPATGAEEDTADEFSALVISAILEDTTGMPPEQIAFMTDVISYSTLLWYHDDARAKRQGVEVPWYDEHSDSDARFRNTLCMIYGSNPTQFKALADRVELPDRERGRCEIDHAKRYRAWELIVQPHARNQGGEYPGLQPADAPGAALKVTYERSATPFGQQLQTEFENLRVFEGLAEGLQGLLVWKRDLDIIFADCGVPNAFYDPSNARIVMCWEGIEYFFWTIAEPEGVKATNFKSS